MSSIPQDENYLASKVVEKTGPWYDARRVKQCATGKAKNVANDHLRAKEHELAEAVEKYRAATTKKEAHHG